MLAHILSDIHLEMDKSGSQVEKTDIKYYFDESSQADILFLLGDIGNVYQDRYWNFMRSCSKRYKKVFVILGNHEMYGTCVENAVKKMREQCKTMDNVVFLNKDTYDIDHLGIRIAGTTLWSHVEDEQMSDIRCFISDHRAILGWSVEENNCTHATSLKWLKREIDRARVDEKKLIIMTHHAPLLNSCHPKHRGSPLSSAFQTDLSDLIRANPHICMWMYGHTHHTDKRKIGETLVISNQHGYSGEDVYFDRSLVIDLASATLLQ